MQTTFSLALMFLIPSNRFGNLLIVRSPSTAMKKLSKGKEAMLRIAKISKQTESLQVSFADPRSKLKHEAGRNTLAISKRSDSIA